MKARRVLAVAGAVTALTPAALAAIIAAHGSGGRGNDDNALQDAIGNALVAELADFLGADSRPEPERDDQPGNAETASAKTVPPLAKVIIGGGEHLSSNLADFALGGGEEPSAEFAGAMGVLPPISDPTNTVAPVTSEGRAGNGGSTAGLSSNANFTSAGGAGGGGRAPGGRSDGTGAAFGTETAGDAIRPVQGRIGSLGLETTDPPDSMPIDSPVPGSPRSIVDSIAALDAAMGEGKSDGEVIATPLPTSFLMFLAAIVGLAYVGRRKISM